MSSKIFRPRAAAFLSIPNVGTSREKNADGSDPTFTVLPVRVNSVDLTSNDFNHADSLELSCAVVDAGLDPRFLGAATVLLHLGNASDTGVWFPSKDNLRFAGVLSRARRSASAESADLRLSFLDYTAFFLECRNVAPESIPTFEQTISESWTTLCDGVGVPQADGSIYSTVSALRKSIRFSENAKDVQLGEAVLPRLRKFGKPSVKPGSDAWGVWQQIIQSLGLISYIRLDELVVTTALDYYSATDSPRMIWGENILEYEDERNTQFARRGIRVVSYDPLSHTTLEAVYPPDGDPQIAKKKPAVAQPAKGKHATKPKAPKVVDSDRETFQYPAVTNPIRLGMVAERIYLERARQEYEGRCRTDDMSTETARGVDFDLISLQSGDTISIEYDVQNRLTMSKFGGSSGLAKAEFIARGYSPEIADLMVRNMSQTLDLPSDMFVKSVSTHLSTDEKSGDFNVAIQFANKLNLDGST